MLIVMVFLAPLLRPLGFFLSLPLLLFLSIQLMLPSLYHIFKLAIHTHHHLDHFHFLATSYVQFLPMNISIVCSSPIDILLGIINESCSFNLSIQLGMDFPLKLVISCSRNPS
jgi:hypothetical protein